MSMSEAWYLVRTKSNRESLVREQLSRISSEVFLPKLKVYSSYRGNPTVVPLFPRYIFARLHLTKHYFDVRYLPGVTGFVPAGREPLEVSEEIVDSVRVRCTDGVVQFRPQPFRGGDRVRVIDGPFRNFEAIFEGYLSGAKRVAILIDAVEGSGVRVIADASIIGTR